jgi:hypothetical protein
VRFTISVTIKKLNPDLVTLLFYRVLKGILDHLEPWHGKASHRIFEFLETDLLRIYRFHVLDEVLPEAFNFAFINPEGLANAVLRNETVIVGVHLLEGLLQVFVTEELLLVGSGSYELVVIDRAVAVEINFVE